MSDASTPSPNPQPAAAQKPATAQPAAAPPGSPAVQGTPTITFEDFAKIDLRIATVLECNPHPNADKLLVLQLDVGGERRQICAGLRQHYAAESLVGKQIIVVANLAPRTMRGQVSQGMLLAASDPATGKVIVVGPTEMVASGSKVS